MFVLMKREIKFRGLRTDGKGWAYGCFIHTNVDVPCIVFGDGEQFEVIPESVCQFTGLKDSKGTEVYEGDIVKLTNTGYGFNTGKVIWGAHSSPSFTAEQLDADFPSTYHLQVRPSEIEIIGNIHENPGLI